MKALRFLVIVVVIMGMMVSCQAAATTAPTGKPLFYGAFATPIEEPWDGVIHQALQKAAKFPVKEQIARGVAQIRSLQLCRYLAGQRNPHLLEAMMQYGGQIQLLGQAGNCPPFRRGNIRQEF